MYYILHGEEEFTRAEELARLRQEVADPDAAGLAELNTTFLAGGSLTFGELRHYCDAVPFMASKRIVIVHDLLARLASRGRGQQSETDDAPAWKRTFLAELAAYLPVLPDTTLLFFIERKLLPPSHPILRLALEEGRDKGAYVKDYPIPRDTDLPDWIQRRSRAKGGELGPQAVTLLAALVGPDLRLLDQEIEKLLLYADGQQVTAGDVRLLVSRAREESIFELVDNLGHGNCARALTILHRLLDDEAAPLYVLAMIARQIRLLMQVSTLRDRGFSTREIASKLSLHPYVAKKLFAQSHRFQMEELDGAHERLLETDWAIKTGEMEDVLALDMLVVALSHRERFEA